MSAPETKSDRMLMAESSSHATPRLSSVPMIYGTQRRKFLPFGRKASVELVGRRIGSQRNVEDCRFSGRCDVANHAAAYWRERLKVKMGNAISGIRECEKATGHIWVRVALQLEDH